MADEYRRFWISSSDAVEREILLATAFEAGAEGAEEREGGGLFRACVYARADRIEEIHRLLRSAAAPSSQIESVRRLPDVDWNEAWKEGLEAVSVSPRLRVRPPFVEAPLLSGQRELVIEPGQAFGTGAHASTRLCLEWIDELLQPTDHASEFDRVLDVGTGSGILALAAVLLGAEVAVGFDLDPVAIEAACLAARRNGLDGKVRFFTGPIDALASSENEFPLVLANLLKSEMLPIASALAEKIDRSKGRLVLAGLLEEDLAEVSTRFGREGLHEVGRRCLKDDTGCWVGLCLAFE